MSTMAAQPDSSVSPELGRHMDAEGTPPGRSGTPSAAARAIGKDPNMFRAFVGFLPIFFAVFY